MVRVVAHCSRNKQVFLSVVPHGCVAGPSKCIVPLPIVIPYDGLATSFTLHMILKDVILAVKLSCCHFVDRGFIHIRDYASTPYRHKNEPRESDGHLGKDRWEDTWLASRFSSFNRFQ